MKNDCLKTYAAFVPADDVTDWPTGEHVTDEKTCNIRQYSGCRMHTAIAVERRLNPCECALHWAPVCRRLFNRQTACMSAVAGKLRHLSYVYTTKTQDFAFEAKIFSTTFEAI